MSSSDRLHALDAVRAFALLLGVLFHAGFSFLPGMIPGLWAIVDASPSPTLGLLLFASHTFRMSLFFLVAGFFARMLFHRKGASGFWLDRAKRILVPLIVGWVILAPTLIMLWMWGQARSSGGKLPEGISMPVPPPPPGAFPLTHLWFLYYLLILYAAVLIARTLFVAIDRQGAMRRAVDAIVRGIVRSGAAALLLPLPLVAALCARPDWIPWFGIPTPDRSVIPELASLVAYGTALAFGWLVQRQIDLLTVWGRLWPLHLTGAVAATGVCVSIVRATPIFTPASAMASGDQLAFAAAYGLAIWCWSFAVIGAAVRFMSHASPRVRYLADASYWIYLAHLPVVVTFQILVAPLPWHWSLKFPLILGASLAVLLTTYRYLVRSTFIGQTLNGRRYSRTTQPRPERVSPRPDSGSEPRVAELTGVQKRYGSTVALAGLDLDVRRGELLAVLGPNGAGKSTALALWLGLIEPDEGEARLFGRSPLDVAVRRQVGVMMQEVALTPELRPRELIALTSSYYPHPLTTEETLTLTRTTALANRPYAKLSGGQKRQVQFALAVCGRPSLLFLDEPTAGLDVEAREAMWRTIRTLVAQGCAVVLTTHYLEEAEALADRVAVIAAGRLVASGTVAGIRSLVARKQISCASRLTIEEVRAWPGVIAAQRDARLRITVVDAEDVVRRLLAADPDLRDLEVRQSGLAEAVTQLTQEAA